MPEDKSYIGKGVIQQGTNHDERFASAAASAEPVEQLADLVRLTVCPGRAPDRRQQLGAAYKKQERRIPEKHRDRVRRMLGIDE